MKEIESIIASLELQAHPEGGYFKETYRSKEVINQSALEGDFSGDRNYCTGIYFLLTSDNFSAFHRIKQDEMWHFYSGSALYVHIIDKDGNYSKTEVGMDLENGQKPQFVVPAGCWFASSVKDKNSHSLVGCTVAPGFDFQDFELAQQEQLLKECPIHTEIIKSLTRQ